ncbi:hypothetical protein [uncultured Clostridium sp.]|uniref:hypothetical protein n=1 Tax=uncultured Clostridium sp. TaxID=59620 RepID=UPI0025FA7B34|nr:hypothetical protein [uncultured Clostridium sp.]
MLSTPLGNLVIQKNGINMSYSILPQPLKVLEKSDYYVDARYLIKCEMIDINPGDVIKCFIDVEVTETYINGGECLALLDFYKDNTLLSLGAYEMLYHCDDNEKFGFDIEYIRNGLEVYFFDINHLDKFKLAISWMDLEDNRDTVSTWYASDPYLCNE